MRLFAKVDGYIDKYDNVSWYGDIFDIRWHPEFPLLTQGPDLESLKQLPPSDPTLRDNFGGGAVGTRPSTLSHPRGLEFDISDLTDADFALLDNFERLQVRYGGKSFFWENTKSGEELLYRFGKPLEWNLQTVDPMIPQARWRVHVMLIEAHPSIT